MAVEKTLPSFRVRCYNQSAIPIRQYNPLAITDVLANSLTRGQGAGSGILSLNGSSGIISIPFQTDIEGGAAPFSNITNCLFIRLLADGSCTTVTARNEGESNTDRLAGFYIQPRIALLDNVIGSGASTAGNTPLHWSVTSGTFKTGNATSSPAQNLIFNSGSDALAQVQTTGMFPANRGQSIYVRFTGGPTTANVPAWRYILPGGLISLSAVDGQPWSVDRFFNGTWNVWDTVGTDNADLSVGIYEIALYRLGGYLIVQINDNIKWFMGVQSGTSPGTTQPAEVSWPAGNISVNCWNCKALFGVSTVQWSNFLGSPLTASFTRTYQQTAPIGTTPTPNATGWTNNGTSISVTGVVTPNVSVSVTVTLNASTGTGIVDGADTPFCNKIFNNAIPVWSTPGDDFIDITPAFMRGSLTMAQPPILPGAEMSIDVYRPMLDQLFGANGWQQYIDRYLPIDFSMKWNYSDGSSDTNWTQLFKGYIISPAKETKGQLKNYMTLTCRDPITRLQGANARINNLYKPADVLYWQKLAANVPNATLYGYEVVQYILQTALGFQEANNLLTYPSPSAAPIFSANNDVCGYAPLLVPIKNGLALPPPFKSDALTWINQIGSQFDASIFYYGWPIGTVGQGWPVPIYGNQTQLVALHKTSSPFIIPDRDYTGTDYYNFLSSADVGFKTENDINVFDVIGNFQGQSALSDYIVADIVASARLPVNDPYNSPEQTWERIGFYDSPLSYRPDVATASAVLIALYQAGRNPALPKLFCQRGQETLQWGDWVQVKQVATNISEVDQSDISLGINGVTFRLEKIVHTFSNVPGEFGDRSFSSELYGTALSTIES